jgi:hypothetical protein
MADSEPKLKIVRRRRKSVKSKIRARATDQMKQAAIEARKVAVLEYVGEQLEELTRLLRAEGFKVSRTHDTATLLTGNPPPPIPAPIVQNPCIYCGRQGVVMNETKTGWLCEVHGQYELGGAAQDRQGQNIAAQMFNAAPPKSRQKPVVPQPNAALLPPPQGKIVIHPNAAEEPKMFDPLKGITNGTVGVLGEDSDEAGDIGQ